MKALLAARKTAVSSLQRTLLNEALQSSRCSPCRLCSLQSTAPTLLGRSMRSVGSVFRLFQASDRNAPFWWRAWQQRSWTIRRQHNSSEWFQRRRYTPRIPEETALYGLMGANVAVFLAWRGDARFMLRHFTTSWDAVREGRLHTLVLSAFSQRDTWHLISNMIGLYFFGRNVAWLLGGRGLVLLYLAGGTFGSLVYVTGQALQSSKYEYQRPWGAAESYHLPHIPSLGSSGAVNSIVMFEIMMVPMATVLLYGILPVPAWILGGLFLFVDINGALGHGSANIGYTAHLGGAAIGALTYVGVKRGRIPSRWGRWR